MFNEVMMAKKGFTMITPLNIKSKLSGATGLTSRKEVEIKDQQGNTIKLADPRYSRCLLALMNLGAVNGGAACHWGGPSAMMEVWTALYSLMTKSDEWYESFNFVNDIGHGENGLYALKANMGLGDLSLEDLKGFRSITSHLTGHGESHLFPEGVLLSNGPLSSAMAQSQGLAMGDKIIGKERVTLATLSDGAAMEGEAREAFAAIPGLAKKNKLNPYILIISDNDTKLGGRITEDSFSMEPTFDSLKALGWEVRRFDGHDLQEVYQGLEIAISEVKNNPTKPLCLWMKTIKGKGVKSTEQSASGGHGFPIKAYDNSISAFISELWGSEDFPLEFKTWISELTTKPENKPASSDERVKEKIQVGVANALIDEAKEGSPVFSLSSDLAGSTGLKNFQKEYPDRFIDVGIAESNMVSAAAGLSKVGLIPIVDTFAAFGVTKGNLPLIMASLSDCPMIAIFSHTGFQDAADGASHQSLTYMSALKSIPYVKIVNLATSTEAYHYLRKAIQDIKEKREKDEKAHSYVFFLGRENFPRETCDGLSYELFSPQLVKTGKDGVIVSTGSMLEHALKASEILKEKGKHVGVIHHPFVNEINTEWFANHLSMMSNKVLTVEDHQLIGGMGEGLCHALKKAQVEFKFTSLGVKGGFGQSSYQAVDLYKKHGLDGQSIANRFLAF